MMKKDKRRKTQESDENDDSRVIAPMNIEGMPWHTGKDFKKPSDTDNTEKKQSDPEPLTKRETFSIVVNAVAAGLLIAGIFIVALILFVLFCTHIWLK